MSTATSVFDRLLYLADLLQRDMQRAFDGSPLTTSRVHLLWVVHHAGPSTQQALATALDVTPRNITGLVDALETSGYVERMPHPTDRRATLVVLTELGRRTMTDMAADHERIANELVDGFEPAELGALATGLDRLAEQLESMIAAHEASVSEKSA